MGPRLVIVGELTLDDVIVEGSHCDWGQIGGGALYSAIGALAWGASPAISATVGADYPDALLTTLQNAGLDLSGVTRIEGNSLGLWLLYEKGGRRHQVEKESGSTFRVLDEARRPWPEVYPVPDGLHVAPQTTEGQLATLEQAAGLDIPVTQDLLVEPFTSLDPYRNCAALIGTTALLPSQQEVRQIWGDVSDRELLHLIRNASGVRHLVITRGEVGADLITEKETLRVPPCNDSFTDPTGAGDAFSGGFLAGLVETGDPVEASIRGAVSASIVVETTGALAALEALEAKDVSRKANELRAGVAAV